MESFKDVRRDLIVQLIEEIGKTHYRFSTDSVRPIVRQAANRLSESKRDVVDRCADELIYELNSGVSEAIRTEYEKLKKEVSE